VGLSAGLMIVGASGSVVVFRHAAYRPLPARQRAKRAVLPLVLLALWIVGGAVYALSRRVPL
jgi:hypothetical protein